jgi:hypothetical protein
VVVVVVSRCRTCGRDAERVLSPAELYAAASELLTVEVFARQAGRPELVTDAVARLCPGRLSAVQLAAFLVSEVWRRGARPALDRADQLRGWSEVADLEAIFELEPPGEDEGPDR